MEYDLRAIVAEALKEYPPLLSSGKDRFTAEDIAERYGIHKDNARRMMNNGDLERCRHYAPEQGGDAGGVTGV